MDIQPDGKQNQVARPWTGQQKHVFSSSSLLDPVHDHIRPRLLSKWLLTVALHVHFEGDKEKMQSLCS